MSTSQLWGEALKNATPEEISRFAAEAPRRLNEMSTGDTKDSVRDTGLLLTKKQIIDLRKYEAAALALPVTLQSVTDYLRFGQGQDGGSGLSPSDFLTTFQNTRNHALRWTPLREKIMLTGQNLKHFAKSILNYGAAVQDLYQELESSAVLDKHNIKTLAQLKALEMELGDKFPGIELESDTTSNLGYFLNRIFDEIKNNLATVAGIKKDLDLFGYDLHEYVRPEIEHRVGLIKSNTLSEEIKLLKARIEEREKEIDIKNTEYRAAVQEALKSAAGMNVVGLAMAIYMGVEAENIRSSRNELYAEQERAIQTLTSKNQTLGSLARIKHDMQNLMVVAIDADIATQNLMHVWSTLHVSVNNSVKAVERIKDALSLKIFVTEFEEVVHPWGQIESDSDRLIQVFKQADEEYERNYSVRTRAMDMVNFDVPGYQSLNRTALLSHYAQMYDLRTEANVWLVKTNFLPDLFDRFNRLTMDMGESSRQLQGSAFAVEYELADSLRRLAKTESELEQVTDPDEILYFEEYRTGLLDQARKVVTDRASLIGQCLANVNDPFDRRLTHTYIADFEREERDATVEIPLLQEKLAAVRDERQAINEAIATLEKNGIEALGKDIELTIGKVTELGLAPPEIKLVMLAIEQLKKTLIDAGNAFRFLDMVRGSDKLRAKIEELSSSIDVEKSIISASQGKVIFLNTIHAMESERQSYADIYRVSVSAFDQFLAATAFPEFADGAAHSNAFKEQARLFMAFLKPLSMPPR